MATWHWLLHVGAAVRLRNFVIYKKEGVLHGRCRAEGSRLDFGSLYGSNDPAHRARSGTEPMKEIKLICALHHYNLDIFPEQGSGGPHATQKALTKVAVNSLLRGSGDPRPHAGSQVLHRGCAAMGSEAHRRGLEGAALRLSSAGDTGPSALRQADAHTPGCHLCALGRCEREGLCCQAPQKLLPSERKHKTTTS